MKKIFSENSKFLVAGILAIVFGVIIKVADPLARIVEDVRVKLKCLEVCDEILFYAAIQDKARKIFVQHF